jgi:TetR/AcrR family transcriptional regulator, mexCD-oprJ operon repressor
VSKSTTDHRRAIAEGNVRAILDATLALLEHDSEPSFVEIARAAGVSRPTLYAHFPTREDLIEAVVARAVDEVGREARAARLDEDSAAAALERLVKMLWRKLSRLSTLARLSGEILPPERRRQAHETGLEPVRQLVIRGQESDEFRHDQSPEWMVSVLYALLHGAADDVAAGRFDEDSVAELLYASLLGAFAPPRSSKSASPRNPA